MTTDTRPSARPSELDDELAALLAARRELGRDLEPEVTAAFLARVEASVAARMEEDAGIASNRNRFTQRIAWSLGLGIPLVTARSAAVMVVLSAPSRRWSQRWSRSSASTPTTPRSRRNSS
jgi:hypothetical protein